MKLNELIRGCKQADRNSQAKLYELTSDELMNVALRYLKSPDDAKDIIQNIYLKVFKKIGNYDDGKGTPMAWMSKIAVNECLQFLRKRKMINIEDISVIAEEVEAFEDIISNLTVQEIFERVSSLPTGYRIVFNLFVVEGYSHKEIGEMLDISPSSSRSQLTRAKATLRQLLNTQIKKIYL